MEKETLKSAEKMLGEGVELSGLMLKKAVLRSVCAEKATDVIGWDYIIKQKGSGCFTCYGAQPPLIGMTAPSWIKCPLGIRPFENYKIDFKQAIEKFQSLGCGKVFTELALYYVVHYEVKEPCWYIRSALGHMVIIGADSGKVMDPIYKE
jgi:hypothetical protein